MAEEWTPSIGIGTFPSGTIIRCSNIKGREGKGINGWNPLAKLLIPVTINYDRILEEELMANELMGFGKPKENASGFSRGKMNCENCYKGLLKARRILGQTFGEIFITIGQPISLREYFLDGKTEDIRMNLIGIGENEVGIFLNINYE